MKAIDFIKKIEKISRKQMEFLYSDFNSISNIFRTSQSEEEQKVRSFEAYVRNTIESFISKEANGNIEEGLRKLVNHFNFSSLEFSNLIVTAQGLETPPELVNEIVKVLVTEEKTKKYILKDEIYNKILEIALNSNSINMAQALKNNIDKGDVVDPVELWKNKDKRIVNNMDWLSHQFDIISKGISKNNFSSYIEKNKENTAQAIRDIINHENSREREISVLLEMAKETTDQNISDIILRTISEEPRTKGLLFDDYLKNLIEMAEKAPTPNLAKAINKVKGVVVKRTDDVPISQPPIEEPVQNETIEEPIIEEPVIEDSQEIETKVQPVSMEEPVVEEPVVEEPIVEEPVAELVNPKIIADLIIQKRIEFGEYAASLEYRKNLKSIDHVLDKSIEEKKNKLLDFIDNSVEYTSSKNRISYLNDILNEIVSKLGKPSKGSAVSGKTNWYRESKKERKEE